VIVLAGKQPIPFVEKELRHPFHILLQTIPQSTHRVIAPEEKDQPIQEYLKGFPAPDEDSDID